LIKEKAKLVIKTSFFFISTRKGYASTQETYIDMKKDLLKAIASKEDLTKSSVEALELVKNTARVVRDLTLEIKDIEAMLEEKKKKLTQITMKDLPDLFDQYSLRSIGLEAEGNLPAYDLTASPYYKAVLPKEDDAGLRWLEDNGHGDMIRRVYTVNLDKDSEEQAKALREYLERFDLAFEEKETVPWNTLTAFVKEQIEKRKTTPPLDILGAIVGKVVKLKPRKD
jgi:hypothetical protein